ncbi:MAG: hypothetical protein ACOH19_03205 [Rhodoglobus sp.]
MTNNANKPTEYGGSPGADRNFPNSRTPRPLTDSERAQAIRRAGMRDEPLPPGVIPGIRVS